MSAEDTISSFRERRANGTVVHSPAWFDLDEAERIEAFEQTVLQRALESALDRDGLSSTSRAVLSRIQRRDQP